jgi:MFS transporter, SP family, sugar:H+ symporter
LEVSTPEDFSLALPMVSTWYSACSLSYGWTLTPSQTFGQIYIQEVIPARYRGASIAAFNVFTSVGTLIGTVVDNFTSKIEGRNCYIIPLTLIFIVPTIISIGLFFIPETPRYLVEKGKVDEARKSLIWLRPHGFNVDAELLEIQTAAAEERETKKATGWLDLFRDPIDRRRTLLSVGAVTTQAASGAFFMIVSRLSLP